MIISLFNLCLLQVEVCRNGSISLRRKLKAGTEEFRVSGDGMDVTVMMENAKQIRMSYSTLQPRLALEHTLL